MRLYAAMEEQTMHYTPEEVLRLYALEGPVRACRPYGDGHINDTYRVTVKVDGLHKHYVLQRISPVAFRQPDKVMENVLGVTNYLRGSIARRGGDPLRETMTIIPLADGRTCLPTDDGTWRMYTFVEGSVTYQQADSTAVFYQAGRAFGRFMSDLADYPAHTLHETIPNFHHTPSRVDALKEAIGKDAAGRAQAVQAEIAFALERASRAGDLVNAGLPLRVTHNDTKLNNVLMDASTREALCVVDLDTVMPGLCAYDFGDAIRFGANTAAEDEKDLDKVHFSLGMYSAHMEGYLRECGRMLTKEEIASLPVGAWMMTYECGIRFLTDYLDGDTYYHTDYPEHNLVRARNQFALLQDMERQAKAMADIAEKWMKE